MTGTLQSFRFRESQEDEFLQLGQEEDDQVDGGQQGVDPDSDRAAPELPVRPSDAGRGDYLFFVLWDTNKPYFLLKT